MAGVPVGLDFGAVMAIGGGLGADLELIAEVLPDVEHALLSALAEEADEE